jgi:Kef-type K+ transport system membrane component KefB
VSPHAIGQLLLALAVIIALARLLGRAARLIGQPPVIGEIVAGILLGPSLFGTAVSGHLFPADIMPALSGLANVGLVLFMFIIGYELDRSTLAGRGRIAVSVSFGSILLPMVLGVLLALWLAPRHDITRVTPFALFVGASMAVTAFPVLARILADRGMLRTEVGGLALASAAVDDIAAWSLLALVVTIAAADGPVQWELLLAVPYVLLMLFAVRPLLGRLVPARTRAGRLTPGLLGIVLIGLLLSGAATEMIGLHAIFGAFMFGAVMPGADELRQEVLERLEQVSVLLLLPVFFVVAGLKVDLSTADGSGLVELAAILVVAVTGKFVGAYVAARLHRVPARRAGALATLMNTRGLTEIVILTIGLQLGLLDDRLFSMMVVMALVTTAMAGPLLNVLYPKRQVARDLLERQPATPGAYRVVAVLPGSGSDAGTADGFVDVAVALTGTRRPAEVVLSRLVPFGTPAIEVGSGIHADLLTMTRVMGDMAELARPVRQAGLTAPVLARLSSDPARDLPAQVGAAEPDVVLMGAEPPGAQALRAAVGAELVTMRTVVSGWDAVTVRADGGTDGLAALGAGARLAQARDVPLYVDTVGRVSRGVAALVGELRLQGVTVETGPAGPGRTALVVGGDDDEGADLRVRAAVADVVTGPTAVAA